MRHLRHREPSGTVMRARAGRTRPAAIGSDVATRFAQRANRTLLETTGVNAHCIVAPTRLDVRRASTGAVLPRKFPTSAATAATTTTHLVVITLTALRIRLASASVNALIVIGTGIAIETATSIGNKPVHGALWAVAPVCDRVIEAVAAVALAVTLATTTAAAAVSGGLQVVCRP